MKRYDEAKLWVEDQTSKTMREWIQPMERDERPDHISCLLCDADLDEFAKSPLCDPCRNGYEVMTDHKYGDVKAAFRGTQRRMGRGAVTDEGAIGREGEWENGVRGLEDNRS